MLIQEQWKLQKIKNHSFHLMICNSRSKSKYDKKNKRKDKTPNEDS